MFSNRAPAFFWGGKRTFQKDNNLCCMAAHLEGPQTIRNQIICSDETKTELCGVMFGGNQANTIPIVKHSGGSIMLGGCRQQQKLVDLSGGKDERSNVQRQPGWKPAPQGWPQTEATVHLSAEQQAEAHSRRSGYRTTLNILERSNQDKPWIW